jgi:hypothetical protein
VKLNPMVKGLSRADYFLPLGDSRSIVIDKILRDCDFDIWRS